MPVIQGRQMGEFPNPQSRTKVEHRARERRTNKRGIEGIARAVLPFGGNQVQVGKWVVYRAGHVIDHSAICYGSVRLPERVRPDDVAAGRLSVARKILLGASGASTSGRTRYVTDL